MALGGYYVATHILMVWKRLAGLAPDQPHGWSFPDVFTENYCFQVSIGPCPSLATPAQLAKNVDLNRAKTTPCCSWLCGILMTIKIC